MTATSRSQRIKAVHVARRALALTDESYRDVLRRVTNKDSAAKLTDRQLGMVLDEFKNLGWRPKPRTSRRTRNPGSNGAQLAKVRALWLSLYWLGEVNSNSDAALVAFVKRLTKREALQWLTPAQINQVIEALKDMCDRAGFQVPPTEGDGGLEAKRELCRCLWRKLHSIGVVRIASLDALDSWLTWKVSPHATGLTLLTQEQLNAAIDRLGRWLRKSLPSVPSGQDNKD